MAGAEDFDQKPEVSNQSTLATCALFFAYLVSYHCAPQLDKALDRVSHEFRRQFKIIRSDEASDTSILGNPLMGQGLASPER